MATTEEKRKALDEQIARLKEQKDKAIAQLKARKSRLDALGKKSQRKADARAKIILGGVMLLIGRRGPEEAKRLLATIEKEVTRDSDKEAVVGLVEELKVLAGVKKAEKPYVAPADKGPTAVTEKGQDLFQDKK